MSTPIWGDPLIISICQVKHWGSQRPKPWLKPLSKASFEARQFESRAVALIITLLYRISQCHWVDCLVICLYIYIYIWSLIGGQGHNPRGHCRKNSSSNSAVPPTHPSAPLAWARCTHFVILLDHLVVPVNPGSTSGSPVEVLGLPKPDPTTGGGFHILLQWSRVGIWPAYQCL